MNVSHQRRALKIRAGVICLTLLAGLAAGLPPARRALTGASAQASLSPQERRGKQIYVQGTSPSGRDIFAYLGDDSLEVPASTLPCANCHGLDGRGKSEGGINPSNISWEALTKPYGVTHQGGRTHPPYTERALELAITRGRDPAGHKLLNVMPRYQMPREDLADLVAYLKRVGLEQDPGLSETGVTVGTVVPSRGELAGTGQAIKAVLSAFFEEVNRQGGIYGRRLDLKVVETADAPASTVANVRRLVRDEQVFALAAAFTAGADRELAALSAELGVPLVGPFTLLPQTAHPLNRQVFYLLSGTEGQARALVAFAARRAPGQKGGALIVHPSDEAAGALVEVVRDQCLKSKCGELQAHGYQRGRFDAASLASELSRTNRDAVFFLGAGEEALALMKEADKLRWSPSFYLPVAAGGGMLEAPLSFSRKIFLSFPTSPADQTAEGIREFRALASKYKLPAGHLATQVSAFSAAKILVEGLKRAGKDVSREKLVEALEGLNQYATGLTPAVTYGPNRRVGAMGAHVITIDLEKKEFLPAGPWVDTN